MTEINEIVKRHNFEVEEPGNIGNQAIAVMDNWAVLEEVEKDIAAEFFYQTKMIKTIMDQNVLFKSLCQSAKETASRSSLFINCRAFLHRCRLCGQAAPVYDTRHFISIYASFENSPLSANAWFIGPRPLPKSSIAPSAPDIYSFARRTDVFRS